MKAKSSGLKQFHFGDALSFAQWFALALSA
jgi:hypothetical protein